MKRFLCVTLLALGLCTTACGSSDPAGNGGGGGDGGNGGGSAAAPVAEGDLAERFATAKCDLLFSCACAGSFSSKETCVNQVRATLQQAQQNAKDLHLSYDASCAGKLLAKMTARACDPITTCETEVCWPYYGTTTFGGACDFSTSMMATTCAQGSTCGNHDGSGTTCGEPCQQDSVPAGAPCVDSQGQKNKLCEQGFVCALEKGGVCYPSPKAGEPCLDMHACAADAYCGGGNPASPTCVARQANGTACTENYVCLGLLCQDGKCADAPAICLAADI